MVAPAGGPWDPSKVHRPLELEHQLLAIHLVDLDAHPPESESPDERQGGLVPGANTGPEPVHAVLAASPRHQGLGRLARVALPPFLRNDLVADLGDTRTVGGSMEARVADDGRPPTAPDQGSGRPRQARGVVRVLANPVVKPFPRQPQPVPRPR